MKKIKISAVVSAFNAEETIETTLKSITFCDEIIFVDNESTDTTPKIAQKYTSKIFKRKNLLMLNINKNFGFSKAEGEWILNIDSDEEITSELKEEILSIISSNPDQNGYWIPRKNIIFGKWIRHTGWFPDYQLRLFRKNKGKFEEKHVHEMVKIDGDAGFLKNPMVHDNYRDINSFIHKFFNIYAKNEAEQMLKNGYQFNHLDSIRFPVKEFLSRFFAREGYKDGFHGLMLSLLMAFYHFVVFALIWEKQGFKQMEGQNILVDSKSQIKESYTEFSYWYSNEKIKTAQGFFKKSLLRLQRKLS